MKQNDIRKTRGGAPRRRPGSSIMPGRISLGRRANTIFTLTKGTQHESLSTTAKAPWKHLQKIVSFSLQFTGILRFAQTALQSATFQNLLNNGVGFSIIRKI